MSTDPAAGMLRYFTFGHLPEKLQTVSEPFATLACKIVEMLPPSAEKTMAMHKLLEAKDCAVRAALED